MNTLIFGTTFWGIGLAFIAFFIITLFFVFLGLFLLNTKTYKQKIKQKNEEHPERKSFSIKSNTPSKNSIWLTFFIFLFFFLFGGRHFWYVHKISISDDNIWTLKNAWNIPLAVVGEDEIESVNVNTKVSAKGFRFTHAIIKTKTKTYRSLSGNAMQINGELQKIK